MLRSWRLPVGGCEQTDLLTSWPAQWKKLTTSAHIPGNLPAVGMKWTSSCSARQRDQVSWLNKH